MEPIARGLFRSLLAMILLALALPALPQEEGYTVELIVFRNGSDEAALAGNAPAPYFTDDDVDSAAVSLRRLGADIARLNNRGLRVLAQAAWKQSPTEWNSGRGVSAARLGLAGVSGKVILERGRFLHLGVDLLVEDGGNRYRITETRQVKPNEVQYFDHPAVGVLAVVTPGN